MVEICLAPNTGIEYSCPRCGLRYVPLDENDICLCGQKPVKTFPQIKDVLRKTVEDFESRKYETVRVKGYTPLLASVKTIGDVYVLAYMDYMEYLDYYHLVHGKRKSIELASTKVAELYKNLNILSEKESELLKRFLRRIEIYANIKWKKK